MFKIHKMEEYFLEISFAVNDVQSFISSGKCEVKRALVLPSTHSLLIQGVSLL
jgi:hypothetical protein